MNDFLHFFLFAAYLNKKHVKLVYIVENSWEEII